MAVESIGGVYNVKIPGLTDAADIQAAFQAYHYGAYTSIATTAGIASDSMAYWLKTIETDIAELEARPSSGGDVANTAPVAGDFTPSGVPNGYIWVDQDGAVTSTFASSTAIYNNNAPTSNLTSGVIWVDKDATTSTSGNPFIAQAIIAAKGDLLAGVSNDTVTVLSVGSNGTYLKADSSTTSGLVWATVDAGDLTAVSAGTGITVTNGAGPIPSVAIDTATTVDLSTAQTLTNKTLTSPVVNLSLNAISATSYTFVLADNGKLVTASNSNAQTYLVPTNATTSFPTGAQLNIIQIGSGQVTIQAATTSTTTISSTGATPTAPKLRAQYSSATLIKAGTDLWYVVGDII